MRLFKIFDRWGNKIGEVYEAGDSLDGLGGFLASMFFIITGAGAILIWPIFFYQLFDVSTGEYERICGLVQLISILLTFVLVGYRAYKADKFSFSRTWISMIGAGTIVPGILYWFFCFIEGERGFILLLASLYICFLLSIGGGLIASILTVIARHVHLKKLESSTDDSTEDSADGSLKSYIYVILVLGAIFIIMFVNSIWECDICGKTTSSLYKNPVNILEGSTNYQLCLDCYGVYVRNGDVPLDCIIN